MLHDIVEKYKGMGIDIAFTGMKGPVRDVVKCRDLRKIYLKIVL